DSYGISEKLQQLLAKLFPTLAICRGKIRQPVSVHGCLAFLKCQPTTWRKFRYSLEQSLGTQVAPIREDLVESLRINATRNGGMAQKGLHLRREQKPARSCRIEERPYP